MGSSFLLGTVAAAIGFFTLFRKLKPRQENKENDASSLSISPVPPSSSSRNWTHDVFPSFRGEDVRRDFLSHVQKEFQRKGITPFIDNEIERGKFISPELIEAIRGSKIAIILFSKNYGSSSWCLDELAEIMNCREELGQTVMTIFYKVDPTDVKKQTGEFGKVFRKTCMGKTKEDIERWRQALVKVATIAGYHSSNWDNEAAMIEKIATDVSNKLNNSTPSRDFDDLVGMEAHMEKLGPLLCLESDEVSMIGIWGPSGIGKTTIARFLFSQLSNSFQLSTIVTNIKTRHPTPYLDEYNVKLLLQKDLLSQLLNQKDIEISHLGVAQERLKDKRVLVVLDDVDRSVQLDAMAKETLWFGPGSRIIVTTQDRKLLKAHGIDHIYRVHFPPAEEALQIFCMYAFGQKFPRDGFEKLAWEVTNIAGNLPLGLRVMGSYFRGMSKQEWRNELPRLRTNFDSDIQSILKFSYDALDDEDKDLFLHIACFYRFSSIERLEACLEKKLVSQRCQVLVEKSLISIEGGHIYIHDLLVKLGIDIARKQCSHDPGKRRFLVDARDFYELLTDNTGRRSVVGINVDIYDETEDELYISERAFEGMSNLRFLRVYCGYDAITKSLRLAQSLYYLTRKLKVLNWYSFPLTSLPSNFHTEYLVELVILESKVEKLWEGIRPLRNLKWMDLNSVNLKEVPDLSTATNLKRLDLYGCSSLVMLPSSIGNATNLKVLDLLGCSNLLELPSSIGNAINLEELNLYGCRSLLKLPSSIGNLHNLFKLNLQGCSKLEALPININMKSLIELDLSNCSMLKSFPEISTNIKDLLLNGSAVEEVPSSIKLWPHLSNVSISYSENLKNISVGLDSITDLYVSDRDIQEVGPWIKNLSGLRKFVLKGCKKLVSIPQLPDSLSCLDAEDCESLERLQCSFHNKEIDLNFANCFKLDKEARDLIIQTSTRGFVTFPGGEVPLYFSHRAMTGDSLTVHLNEKHLPTPLRFKVCILLVKIQDNDGVFEECKNVYTRLMDKQNSLVVPCRPAHHSLRSPLMEHLYTFEVEAEVTSSELVFDFKVEGNDRILDQLTGNQWEIREYGVLQLGITKK